MKEGYPASAEGYIFVEFANIDGARAAALALNGRKFDNKTVIVQFVSVKFYYCSLFANIYFSFSV
jgi:RNA recognition motif-containing protein